METNITHEDTVTRVLEALESIRPFLNKDGGDIELIDVKDNLVYVKLLGNCSGCSTENRAASAMETTLAGGGPWAAASTWTLLHPA